MMLEIRYDKSTKVVTAWCADENQFGNLSREGHAIVVLDIPIPEKSCLAYLYDEATEGLVENSDYVEPEPSRDLATEMDEMKARVEMLENP